MIAEMNLPDSQQICKEAERVTQQLWSQVCGHEKDMIKLGSRVQNCATQAAELQSRLSGIFQSLQGTAEGHDQITEIQTLIQQSLQDIDDLYARLKNMLASLSDSAESMQDLRYNCEKLQASARLFQVLALNMRIQAATVAGGAELFDTMVTATKQLAEDIAFVEDSVAMLIQKSLEASVRAKELLERQLPKILISKQRGSANLDTVGTQLRDLRQGVSSGTRGLQEKSTRLSQGISEVVISLQFQDRTRQRIEHLVNTLQECSKLEPNLLESLLILTIAQIEDELTIIQNIEVQANKALHEMEQQLRGILSALDKQGGQNSANVDWGPLLGDLGKLVRITMEQQNIGKELEKEAWTGLERFEASTEKVQEQLKTIIAWEVKSKVLALNSIILAGQLGEGGVGLAVISQEIVRKSEELSEVVAHIGKMATSMNQHREGTRLHSPSGTNGENLLQLIQHAKIEIETYRDQMNKGAFSGLINEIQLSINSLQAVKKMANHFALAINTLEEFLRLLTSRTNNRVPLLPELSTHSLFEKIQSHYTMAEERIIFAKCFGVGYTETSNQTAMESTGDIELF